jgi:type VI secretion system protein ImpL
MLAKQKSFLVLFQAVILVLAYSVCETQVRAADTRTVTTQSEGSRSKWDSIREAHARAQDSIQEARARAISEANQRIVRAKEDYRIIARRFNRDLAGRYPFGSTVLAEANPRFVCEFFRDYKGRWDSLQTDLDTVASFRETRGFLKDMAFIESFLTGNLCAPLSNPVRVTFQPMLKLSRDGYLIRSWSLSDGFGKALYPEGPKNLDWAFGSPVIFEIKWVDWSAWLPLQDTTPNFYVDGNRARFLEEGDWSLIRLIEKHRDKDYPRVTTSHGHSEIQLKFIVPILHKHEISVDNFEKTAFYVRLNFDWREPGSRIKASRLYRPLVWPGPFPEKAPEPYRRL